MKSSRRSRQKSGGTRIVAGYLSNICDSGALSPRSTTVQISVKSDDNSVFTPKLLHQNSMAVS